MRMKLGEILVEQGAVRPEDVAAALEQQSMGDPARIGDLLIAGGKVTPVQLAKALSLQSGLPFVQLEQVSPQVAALVPMTLQREHCLVPFKEDGPRRAIHVAVADPTTSDVLADLEFQVGRSLKISVAARDEIEAVHAALQGDVLEGAIIEDDVPAPAAPSKPQALGRVALKRVAVSASGVVTEAAPVSHAIADELPVVEAVAAVPPPPVASPQALPPRAVSRPRPVAASPPVLTPTPSAPRQHDEWAVRPAGAAIPRPGASMDPLSVMPTEEIAGPREYVPAPLSALEADPDVRETLLGTEAPAPAKRSAPSKIAIDPGPLALTPPQGRRKAAPVAKPVTANAELPPPPVATPAPDLMEVTMQVPARTATVPAPAPVPSGRDRRVETRLEFNPPVVSVRAQVKTDPAWPNDMMKTDPMNMGAAAKVAAVIGSLRGDVSTTPQWAGAPPEPVFNEALEAELFTAETMMPDPPEEEPVAKAQAPDSGARAREKAEREKAEREKAEREKAEREKAAREKAAREKAERERLERELAEQAERERVERERLEREAAEQAERERLEREAAEQAERERLEREAAEQAERERLEREAAEQAERERLERLEREAAEQAAREQAERQQRSSEPPAPHPVPLPYEGRGDAGSSAEVSTHPDIPSVRQRRTESLEFIPPVEASPRRPVQRRAARTDSLEFVPPTAERAATPPGGTPVARPALDEASAATPPEGTPAVVAPPPATPPEVRRAVAAENLVSSAAVAPVTLSPPEEDVLPGQGLLTAAPVEPAPAAAPAAPTLTPAPVDLAVSELPDWMRDSAPAAPIADPLVAAIAEAGATTGLARVLRVLIKRGLLTEEELIEELKKR